MHLLCLQKAVHTRQHRLVIQQMVSADEDQRLILAEDAVLLDACCVQRLQVRQRGISGSAPELICDQYEPRVIDKRLLGNPPFLLECSLNFLFRFLYSFASLLVDAIFNLHISTLQLVSQKILLHACDLLIHRQDCQVK